jgi:8-oxo-dGTP pyrophosphatase MutT (NUDIX family)
MKQIHTIQLQILKKMLFKKEARYSEIKPSKNMENNQFDFHLSQLTKAGYVKKSEGKYSLTNLGKEYANRMDTDIVLIARQAKVSVLLCPVRNNMTEYLIYTRLKQPFYGCQGFMSGKVKYGERIIEAASRELQEETGLLGNPVIFCIKHYLVTDKKTGELLEDKILFYCKVNNPTGKIRPHNEGKYEWVKLNDLPSYVTNHFESYKVFKSDLDELNSFDGNIKFQEIVHPSEKF